MGVRLLPQVDAELDDIWLYIARESGSADIANRLIDTIIDRFWLVAKHPQIGRRPITIVRPRLGGFAWGSTGLSIALLTRTVILHVMRGSRDIEGFFQE